MGLKNDSLCSLVRSADVVLKSSSLVNMAGDSHLRGNDVTLKYHALQKPSQGLSAEDPVWRTLRLRLMAKYLTAAPSRHHVLRTLCRFHRYL